MIALRLNSFVVMEMPNRLGREFAWGRVNSIHTGPDKVSITVTTNVHPTETNNFHVPPWKITHCHHQPVAEFMLVNGRRVFVEGADDTPEWRLVGSHIAKAMEKVRKKRRGET